MAAHMRLEQDDQEEEKNQAIVIATTTTRQPQVRKMASNRSVISSSKSSDKIKRNFLYKIKILLLICLTFGVAAFISHFYLPKFLEDAILEEFTLDPDSASYPGWQKTNIPIYSYYYFFNITNADQLFMSGVKPQLQEIGPYVFEQIFEKVNISWNHENGTVQYQQIKRWMHVPSKTNGSLDDEIVHINVPLMSGIYQVESVPEQDKFLAYESLNSLIDAFKIPFIMKHKVRHLLFEGYDDDLLTTASSFYPSEVSQTKFGWLYEKNNTSSDGLFRIHTGRLNFGKELGLIDTWNNENENTKWNKGDKCRSFNQTTTGDLQPLFFLQQNHRLLQYFGQTDLKPSPSIRMFIADMCRTFDLEYKEDVENNRLKGYRYQMGPDTFNYSFEENRCYCNKSCPPNGLFDLGVCTQDSPIFTSSPHFLFGDASLQESVLGLQPNASKHQFIMEFDKKFGIAMKVDVKFQLNIFARKSKEIEIMADWPDDFQLYLPQFWFITQANIDDSTSYQLYFISEILPLVLFLTTMLIGLVSVICFIYLVYILTTRVMSSTLKDIPKYESVNMLETKSNCQD